MTRHGPPSAAHWPVRIVALGSTILGFGALGVAAAVAPAATPYDGMVEILGVSFLLTGWLIIERRPGNSVGPILLLVGVLAGYYTCVDAYVRLPGPPPGAALIGLSVWLLDGVFFTGFAALLLVFPTGRLLTPRWRAVIWLQVAASVLFATARTFTPGTILFYPWLQNPLGIAGFPESVVSAFGYPMSSLALGGAAVSVVVRWRRANGLERAQLKWAAGAGVVFVVAFLVFVLTWDPRFDPTRSNLLWMALLMVGAVLLPIAIAIAVLRYRLYEIDRLISRTVAWATVTGILVGTFTLAIVGLQAVLVRVTGGDTLAVAASTLSVAALFSPLRTRVQRVADRHFNRARIDAEGLVTGFAARLRDEVDLASARNETLGVVVKALQPQSAAVWIRTDGRRR